jgi:NADPH:quinone reductase-like Zn-dependent oxidoreductase
VALVLNYVTAWQMLHRVAKCQRGQRILVHGAAGGVGTALLQLGKLAGLELYGTASGGKHELVRQLGAEPIDYQREDFVARLQELTGDGVDAVFDPIGGKHLARSHRVVRRGGILVSYGVSSMLEQGTKAALLMMLLTNWYKLLPDGRRSAFYGIRDQVTIREDLVRLIELCHAGQLEPIIGARLPLSEARRAHELIEQRAVCGKIVLC